MPDLKTVKNAYFKYFKLEEKIPENHNLFDTLIKGYKYHHDTPAFDIDHFLHDISPLVDSSVVPTTKECILTDIIKNRYIRLPMLIDGNCLFHSLCNLFNITGKNNFSILRQTVVDYIKENKEELIKLDWIEDGLERRTIDDYIKYIKSDTVFGGLLEIYIVARMYKRKIIVLTPYGTESYLVNNAIKYIYKISSVPLYLYNCGLSSNDNPNHFEVLVPLEQPKEEKKQDLFLDIEGESSIPLYEDIYSRQLKEKFIVNIRQNKNIKKETRLNIVFYASGNPRSEIFLIEYLLYEGYLINNIMMIDTIYDKPSQNIKNMQRKLKQLYDINLLLFPNYDSYIEAVNINNIELHLIMSIKHNYVFPKTTIPQQIITTNNIIKTQKNIIRLYKSRNSKVPANIILYNINLNTQIIKECIQQLSKFHCILLKKYQNNKFLLDLTVQQQPQQQLQQQLQLQQPQPQPQQQQQPQPQPQPQPKLQQQPQPQPQPQPQEQYLYAFNVIGLGLCGYNAVQSDNYYKNQNPKTIYFNDEINTFLKSLSPDILNNLTNFNVGKHKFNASNISLFFDFKILEPIIINKDKALIEIYIINEVIPTNFQFTNEFQKKYIYYIILYIADCYEKFLKICELQQQNPSYDIKDIINNVPQISEEKRNCIKNNFINLTYESLFYLVQILNPLKKFNLFRTKNTNYSYYLNGGDSFNPNDFNKNYKQIKYSDIIQSSISYDEFSDDDINILLVGNSQYGHYIILRKTFYPESEINQQLQQKGGIIPEHVAKHKYLKYKHKYLKLKYKN